MTNLGIEGGVFLANEQILTTAALESAIKLETDGKAYYLKMSLGSGNAMGKKLFQSLAAEEDIHRQKFEMIFKAIAAQKSWPDVKIERHIGSMKTIFAEATKDAQFASTEMDAVEGAMKMENKTRDFYLGRAEKAVFPAEKKYYETLAKEERIHHTLLQDYFEYMQNPAQYFSIKEKHSLDG
jgi:rubrerythrin